MAKAERELPCPQCGSTRTWRDGIRQTRLGQVQRHICRNCGYRFSNPECQQLRKEPIRILIEGLETVARTQTQRESNALGASEHVERIPTKALKSIIGIPSSRQICVNQAKGAKNLVAAEKQTQAAGISPENKADIEGIIAKYLAYLEREGYAKDITYPRILRTLHKRGANLYHPESVKQTIARQPWKDGYKLLAVYAYDTFCNMEKIAWEKPEYKQEDAIVFVPDEKELDQLIAACRSRRMSTFLQCLKETYADPTEILRLKWIDLHENILTINAPVKRHLPGQVKISDKLVAMLNSLPRKSERIFPTSYPNMRMCFNPIRNKAAIRLQNPRPRAITFKSFRHWGGTMLAHYTNGNVLAVKKALRHRAIQSTMKYIGILQFKDDDYEVATATTVEEIKQLAQVGFQKFDELNGIHVFRKPKKFSA
jgi:integrase/predicted RNA-binding Zn-ribbon protein involved in translation (DUF1610 family)